MKQLNEITELDELITSIKNLKTRGQIKRLGKWLDQSALLGPFTEFLLKQGFEVEGCAGKHLIKIFLNRSKDAQKRSNPVHIDEGFICAHCSRAVASGGAQIRDHCPYCLHGLHLDLIPGDRAANCSGVMVPLYLETQSGLTWIHYRCSVCSHAFRVRAHKDDELLKFVQLREGSAHLNGDK
mgnify:CR=1 FL=1